MILCCAMKWKKLGRIFEPARHVLPNDCVEFAQSPQALVFEDFVRIYFSTRRRDHTGKYLSHVAYVDMDKTFREVLRISKTPVIELGGLGSFDEHGIFPIHVMRAGDRLLAFTTGWNRKVSVSADASIGLAISEDDGLSFKKYGQGPVLTSSLYEPFLIGDPFVVKFGSTFHMWYVYGVRWIKHSKDLEPDRVYKIGHATSEDAVVWHKEGRQIIDDRLNSDECQALPTVFQYDNRHHMLFCYREAISFRERRDCGYRIGYAYSDDVSHWTRDDGHVGINVSADDWDSDMQCYPHVFRCDQSIYMLYNGNEFGRYGFGIAVLEQI